MTDCIGVFADAQGWRMAAPDRQQTFGARTEALAAALRQAQVIAWRGGEAEVVFQERPGGELRTFVSRPEDD